MDALQSFTYLNDSLPSWLSKLDDLTLSVAEHNARFIELARLGTKSLKKKNPSTESLRDGPVHQPSIEGETDAKATDIYVPPNPSHQCLSHAIRARNAVNGTPLVRKRKGSNTSILAEQPRYRSKSMLVVYYDSAVQDSFESLFRSIATARNNLRKGKTAVTFKAHMSSLGMGESSYPADGEHSTLDPKFLKLGIGRRTRGPDLGADGKLSYFDEADKDLETTQNLCEVAAHQFLRDGDCRLEIDGIRKRLENCGAIAKREVERLKVEESREQEEKKSTAVIVEEEQAAVMNYVEAKMNPPPPLQQFTFTPTGVIEIDDSPDTEPVQIDLSAFKLRTRRVR